MKIWIIGILLGCVLHLALLYIYSEGHFGAGLSVSGLNTADLNTKGFAASSLSASTMSVQLTDEPVNDIAEAKAQHDQELAKKTASKPFTDKTIVKTSPAENLSKESPRKIKLPDTEADDKLLHAEVKKTVPPETVLHENRKERISPSTLVKKQQKVVNKAEPLKPVQQESKIAEKGTAQRESVSTQTGKAKENSPATLAASGVSKGASKGGDSKGANYGMQLRQWIESHKRYPRQALAMGVYGVGRIRVTIDRMGHVLNVVVIEKTQNKALDKELQILAHRASPFPSMPDSITSDTLTFNVSIRFGEKDAKRFL